HLNSLVYDRDYDWNDNGDLVRISSPRQTREYGYSATGRLASVRTLAPDLDISIPYATDPAGNRLPDPELHPDSTLTAWPDNRIAEDAHYLYRYDEYGRLTEKTDRIPAGVIRTDDERTHHYHYDSQHRLVFYTRIQHGEPLVESRYLYDPLGRRTGKRVWRRERDLTGWMSLSRKPELTWYGWDGDRLTTIQTQKTRIQTVYQPGSFTPLIRVETENGEREKAQRRSLAEKLQQEGSEDGHGVVFPAELVMMLDRLEREIRADRVSSESHAWLAQCGLTVERLAAQIEPVYLPERKIHLYHCDHRGLPLALISTEGATEWRGEYDEWGNQMNEENPHHLYQPYRLPGQQYDDESGLCYNRYRYYEPLQGRYITQDPIGLKGGLNPYQYPLNPIEHIDPLGLALDLIYNSPSDPIYKGSLNVREFPTGFTVGGHGTPTSMNDDRIKKGSVLTIKQLASDIRANPKYHEGMPVVLFSCETGKGKNSFAQQLANELDVTVIAPDEIIWIWPDGNYDIMGQTARITIGGKDNGAFELVPDEKQPGDFHKFTPTGSK
ncbi:RHS repeat protein, partial [Escherichia albertii]|nr:RHS repeat protein [Escherichia albertii]